MHFQTKILILTKNIHRREYLESVWQLLLNGYKDVEGGLHFENSKILLNTTVQWKIILYKGKVIAVTIYKKKKGLKLVALTVSKVKKYKNIALQALTALIKKDLKSCWMELSESAERFVMKFAKEYVIPNYLVSKILDKDVELSKDGFHYSREIKNIRKEKILLGTPVL